MSIFNLTQHCRFFGSLYLLIFSQIKETLRKFI